MTTINKKITFRHMDSDQVIENYINKHLKKVERFLQHEPSPIDIDVTVVPSKTREHHKFEVRVKSPHYDLMAAIEKQGTDFYDAVNTVVDKMMQQLRKAKERRVSESHNHEKLSKVIVAEEEQAEAKE